MIADKMKNMVANSSAIRAMFEEGTRLAGIYGRENVFDFSLGNPSVPAPDSVREAIIDLVNNGYPKRFDFVPYGSDGASKNSAALLSSGYHSIFRTGDSKL